MAAVMAVVCLGAVVANIHAERDSELAGLGKGSPPSQGRASGAGLGSGLQA
eukprot:CAMPEP_0205933364 /NCGR_PEP_ID=MMETSP1325-20131115/32865_1 /ASSEMBLY_ACC=CAM_ASM_000708 /TAXON_ID=236786 /ORGANISM="Florenciella sp., Strain RCC1007" /LENGTH=50 /DNA_ID=CAMNT_0053303209 /DNA_START=24 /DNA_END=176 /DNA_ORIENTATION=-